MSAAEENLTAARKLYEAATAAYWVQRDIGGIAPLDRMDPDDSDEIAKGAKFKCTTPAARTVLALWQRRKAELDHAAGILQRERGDASCVVCSHTEARMAGLPTAAQLADMRLPPGDRE